MDQRLILGRKQPIVLRDYIDSNFVQDIDNWKSILGFAFSMGSGAISWSSRKQSTFAGSSTEVEYVTADHALKEAMWLWTLLSLIGHPQKALTLIHCDNMGMISLIQNLVFHSCTKHMDMKHHYICNQFKACIIEFK